MSIKIMLAAGIYISFCVFIIAVIWINVRKVWCKHPDSKIVEHTYKVFNANNEPTHVMSVKKCRLCNHIIDTTLIENK